MLLALTLEPASNIRLHAWNTFPGDLQDMLRTVCATAWEQSSKWSDKDLQQKLETQARSAFGPSSVRGNVRLSELGVSGSQAEVDIVVAGTFGGFLLQVGGHTLPRHEKELLECMSVSLVNAEFSKAVFVVCSDNQLTLEGRRSSFDYCKGALLRLAEPALNASKLQGVLIVGLPTPVLPLQLE